MFQSPYAPYSGQYNVFSVAPQRGFHASSRWREQHQEDSKLKAEPKAPEDAETKAPEDTSEARTEPASEGQQEAQQEDKSKPDDEKTAGGQDGKKEDLPPPPPHGDKTPWQVFMETMQSEFKQSKEWEESTKALADGAHQFTESESVQRARKAYEATSGAVSDTAGKVFKSTATAVGKGAAWTWETPVMKGVRKGANATGEVLDKATKPIRETEAYKNVKDVIDDGSSSRYGGWVEKEERRKRRELRAKLDELNGGNPEVFQEDPK